MNDFANEMAALAAIAQLPPSQVHPFRVEYSPELVSGAAPSTRDIQIAGGYCAVLLNVSVNSYPKIAGVFEPNRRQPYSYADHMYFQFTKGGRAVTPQNDYHVYLGDTFMVVDQGKITLAVQLDNQGPAIDSQLTNITLAGVLLPRSNPVLNRITPMSVLVL